MYTYSTKNIEGKLPWNRKGGRDSLQLIFNDEILNIDPRDRGHNDANIILSVNNVFSRNIMENLIFRNRIERPGPKNENVNIIFLILKINGEALNIYHLRRFNEIRAK